MNSDQKLKTAQLRVEADRSLASEVENYKARDMLLDTLTKTPAARAFIFGDSPAPTGSEMVSEIWATDVGQDLRDLLAQSDAEASTPSTDRANEIERITKIENPAEKMNAARAAGLM